MELALGLFIYFLLEHELSFIEKNKKIRNNYLSSIHIFVCLLTYSIGFFSNNPSLFKAIMYGNTGGFFINEVGFFYREREFTKIRMALTLHNIVVLMIIVNAEFNTYIYFLLFMAELTNLPGNILYYYIQLKKEYKIKDKEYKIPYLQLQKKIQAYFYITIRVFISPYFVYKSFIYDKNIYIFNRILFIPIYIIGVFWSKKLYNSIYK